jgi:hypothetical protein
LSKPNIENILKGLKLRLNERNSLTTQSTDGHLFEMSFKFNPPIAEDVLNLYNYLPEDYRCFLRQHNGADFFSWEYGTLFNLYSLEKALSIRENVKTGEYVPMEYKDDWFPIGYVQDIGELFIELSSERNYLFLLGIPIYALLCNFSTWLDRMIRANGEMYWEWASKEL